jgi:3-hydroxyisobutyrate dehydrogenase-like beta-hydroxyacid dehydrogenase
MTPTETIGTDDAAVLYSGPVALFDAHRPTLEALGGTATYLGGDPGRASAHEVALLDLFWTAMSGFVHAVALARTEGISAADLAPHAAGIAGILPAIFEDLAARIDAGDHHGDDSSLRSTSSALGHIVEAAEGRGIDTSVLAATRALVDRAVAEGHGDDGFSRIAPLLAPADAPR